MTAAEEIRRLDARLERIVAASAPVTEFLQAWEEKFQRPALVVPVQFVEKVKALLAAIDGTPEEGRVTIPMCTHAGVVSQAECPYCKPASAAGEAGEK